ncbi:arylsulfatase [Pontiella agarivorans]|uniref:Arylsulfatase n=1 Tax=Pontiella agarivorans TaxID=3038953 RepID=A0ABU5MS55_9BACT|nr:arylsulfatase [Pontiella agarivorans]MDZ8117042.1 arylsulfatase [Pontiella agarivorans]
MNKTFGFLIGSFCVALLAAEKSRGNACSSAGNSLVSRPNVVLIMCDDMGFSDLGCYGSEIETPNIDALANEGIRFSNFKNAGRCCPSRASLLTGRYQHSVGMGWMTVVDEHRPGYRGQITGEVPTIAEVFKANGYSTYMSGKWHVTVDGSWRPEEDAAPNGSWPTQRGFDEFYGSLSGGGNYYKVKGLKRNTTAITDFPKGYYYTHAITKHAVEFIEHHNTEKPMFMYLAHYAPHVPLQAPAERVEKCKARYAVGYDVLRQQRFQRLEKLGLIPSGKKLPANNGEFDEAVRVDWSDLSEEKKEVWVEEMATYAAMIEVVDDGIGEVVNTLKKKGMYENTYFLFLSDNGGSARQSKLARLRADLTNTPYRLYKCFTYSGGISSPLIIKAPESILFEGSLRHDLAHITDVFPTCLDLAGVEYPETFHGEPISGPDGISLLPALRGDSLPERDLFFEHQTSCAVISGDYKLVRVDSRTPWELIDLKADPFETTDLSSRYPEKAIELEKKWTAWATRNHVFPLEEREWKERVIYYKEKYPDQRGDR